VIFSGELFPVWMEYLSLYLDDLSIVGPVVVLADANVYRHAIAVSRCENPLRVDQRASTEMIATRDLKRHLPNPLALFGGVPIHDGDVGPLKICRRSSLGTALPTGHLSWNAKALDIGKSQHNNCYKLRHHHQSHWTSESSQIQLL